MSLVKSHENRLLLETVQAFMKAELHPHEDLVDKLGEVPLEIGRQIEKRAHEAGLYAANLPEEVGGGGLSLEAKTIMEREFGKTSHALHSWVARPTEILLACQGDQVERYLLPCVSGAKRELFALTEPEAGSDAASLRTTAIRDGNVYVVNGTKRYITNAAKAGAFTLMARTNPHNKGAGGISAFFVPSTLKGITVGKPEKKMGQQGAHIHDVIFENCEIPAECLIGEREGEGFKLAMQVLDRGRIHIAAVCVGVAERLVRDSTLYALEREQFGERIANFQMVQAMLADSKTEAYAARCMVLETARKRDAGQSVAMEASCCKLFASEAVGRIADRNVQIHGGAGYVADYAAERFYRDVRIFRLYEGTSQIQQTVIAKNMLRNAG